MTTFRVHFTRKDSNTQERAQIEADAPDDAATIIRKRYPGCTIGKVKVDRTANH